MIQSSTYYSYSFECRDRGDYLLEKLCLLEAASMSNHLAIQRLQKLGIRQRDLKNTENKILDAMQSHLHHYQENGGKTPDEASIHDLEANLKAINGTNFKLLSKFKPRIKANEYKYKLGADDFLLYTLVGLFGFVGIIFLAAIIMSLFGYYEPFPEDKADQYYRKWKAEERKAEFHAKKAVEYGDRNEWDDAYATNDSATRARRRAEEAKEKYYEYKNKED